MLWTQLGARLEPDLTSPGGGPRLTMVVLRATDPVDHAEAAFYRDTEFGALADGAAAGLIVLAFAAVDTDELILFSAEPVERVARLVAELPFVAAGLARPKISQVRVLRLAEPEL